MSPRLQPMRRREILYIALHNSGRASRPALGRRDSTIIDRVRAASLHLHLLRMPQLRFVTWTFSQRDAVRDVEAVHTTAVPSAM
jgi:hypothetical protein